MGVWRKSEDLDFGTAGIWPGLSITLTTRESDYMRQSPGLKDRLSFQGGLPCPSFCSSKANPRPPHRRCCALQKDQSYNHNCIIGPNQRRYGMLPPWWWYAHAKSPNMLCQPQEGGNVSGNRKHPPIPKRMVLANACPVPCIPLYKFSL